MAQLGRLARPRAESAVLLLCDIQERFRRRRATLARTAALLRLPVVTTEQYPKAFGRTVRELDFVAAEGGRTFEKLKFSMWTAEVEEHVRAVRPGAADFILTGLETHVCVQQTALELLERGHRVHVIVDGVSSQRAGDRAIALRLLERAGAALTTTESVMLGLLGGADHPDFKAVAALLKAHNAGRSTELDVVGVAAPLG
jgi:hypothetical protein